MTPIVLVEQDGGFTVNDEEGVLLTVMLSKATLDADLAAYDPASATSPSVTTTREYVRAIFDAVLAARKQP